jgi:hypothetical protein
MGGCWIRGRLAAFIWWATVTSNACVLVYMQAPKTGQTKRYVDHDVVNETPHADKVIAGVIMLPGTYARTRLHNVHNGIERHACICTDSQYAGLFKYAEAEQHEHGGDRRR